MAEEKKKNIGDVLSSGSSGAALFEYGRELKDSELYSNPSQIEAGVAGIMSGVIRVPAGVVSFGADLLDLGLGTEYAIEFEKLVNTVDPFDDIAQQKALGKITSSLTQLASLGKIGMDIVQGGVKAFGKAMKAKRAGKYANLTNPNVRKAVQKTEQLNRASKTKRYATAVTGAALGETFVFDQEVIGTLGDVFQGGPTQLDRDERENPQEDALRRLMNRAKFGTESLLVAPFVYGASKFVGAVAQRGKDLAYSNSMLERFFDKIASGVRARGAKPQELFEAKRTEIGRGMADTNKAMELVREIDKNISKMFPTIRTTFNKTAQKERKKIVEDLNEIMFSGKLDEPIPVNMVDKVYKTIREKNLSRDDANELFQIINEARSKFAELINLSSNAPADIATLRGLMGERVGEYLGNTYRIFEDKSVLPFQAYKPTDEAMNKAKELFKRYAQKNGQELTDLDAEQIVNNLLKTVPKNQVPGELPFFKYIDLTPLAEKPYAKKAFQRVVEKDISGETISEVIGPGSKIFRDLFGEIKDPRYSIYNAMTKLSGVARKNQLFDELATKNDELISQGQRGFFYTNPKEAQNALPYQDIVALDDYLLPFFKGEYAINPLQGTYTSKAIAEGLANSQNFTKFLRGERVGATLPEKGIAWMYRNLVLFPKAASQIAKTVLSPVTHFRNFFSASAFAGANGVFFEKSALNGLKQAAKTIQVGETSKQARDLYRELLELGVVNSEVRLGDLKALMKDTKMLDGINFDSGLKAILKVMGKVRKGAEDLYTAEDDFWKITNYFVEKDRLASAYAKAGIQKTARELKEEAADIVRNTVPNYAYVSDTVRALRALPLGNFMSFPAEILRTGTNIVRRGIKEINTPGLEGIGYKRLFGMATVTAAAPPTIQAGFQGLYDVADEELEAIKKFLPEWSKNSTILPIKTEDGKYKYIDFSHGNAYDTLSRPVSTVINKVQEGIKDEKVLMDGLTKGILEAAGELVDPFISESIFTEAALDILARGGVTREGRRLYTDQTPEGDKAEIIIKHLSEALMPFSKNQVVRLYQSALDKADKRGEKFELPDELLGFAGFRAVPIDPLKALGYEISKYQMGERDARREFTGGQFGVLKGGEIDPKQIIRQYFIANRSLFNVRRDMHNKIKAAQTLNVERNNLFKEFDKRQISSREFGQLDNGIFVPYFPSNEIQIRFREIADNLGIDNPFEIARDTIMDMRSDFRDLDLNEPFSLNLEDYLPSEEPQTPQIQPQTIQQGEVPMPNTQIVQSTPSITQTGLTPTENALLSDEEKQIRLRQRGMV